MHRSAPCDTAGGRICAAVDPLGDGALVDVQAEAGGAVFDVAVEAVAAGVGALAVDARPQPLEEGVALVVWNSDTFRI